MTHPIRAKPAPTGYTHPLPQYQSPAHRATTRDCPYEILYWSILHWARKPRPYDGILHWARKPRPYSPLLHWVQKPRPYETLNSKLKT